MKRVLIEHAAQIATPLGNSARHGKEMRELQVIEDGAVYIEDGVIQLVGTTPGIRSAISSSGELPLDVEIIDATGKALIPGFVDSHTHFIFGGYRPEEFLMRLQGISYMEIMKSGGGIASTVKATRETDYETLLQLGRMRLADCLQQGVTTMEGKSGYGLDKECELRQLQVMKELQNSQPVDLVTTYLGAHDVAPEYKDNPEAYIRFMAEEVLPEVKKRGLATFVDVFCEDSVFDIEQARQILNDAKELGFDVKIHADEIVSLGGAELAADINAVSADHLLAASQKGIKKLAESKTVATLLPCTAFCLNKPYADARNMIDNGCAVALATDYNPGSCFTNAIPLLFALGGIQMHMCMEETLTAVTLNGAAALGLADRIGSIEVGKDADLLFLQYPDYRFLIYHTGKNIVDTVMKHGDIVYTKQTIQG